MKWFITILLLVSCGLAQPVESTIAFPVETSNGIVFTNAGASTLYLSKNGSIEELVTAPGCGMYNTLSPDGKTIGFKYINEDGFQSPALLDIAAKKITRLHTPVRQAGQVSFSRNGLLAYSIGNDAVLFNGSTTTTIPLGTYANLVTLSPDGKYLAFNDDDNRLFIINTDSRESRRITPLPGGYVQPLWSPVANIVCYSRLDGHLFTYNVQTKRTSDLGEGYNPVWSGDGTSLIVERRETEKGLFVNSDLYNVRVDGSVVKRITSTADVYESEPSVRPNGEIVFRSYNNNTIYSIAKGRPSTVIESIAQLPHIKQDAGRSLKKISSDAFHFDMPYTNQVYDTPDWYNGSAACGPTAAIMVIAYYNLLPAWDVVCAASSPVHVSSYGNYICEKYQFRSVSYTASAGDPNGKTSWGGYGYMWTGSEHPYTRMVPYYKNHGLSASLQDYPSLSFVTSEVTAGHPYTLCNGLTTAGHIIDINGIGAEAHTLVANDPYGNKNSGSYPSRNGVAAHYDWPGYNNGFRNLNTVYWGVSVRYTPPAIGDSIVDDLQFSGGFSMSNSGSSSMYNWQDMNQGFNGHLWYVKTKKSDICYATWTPSLKEDGVYDVAAYIPYGAATAARYTIRDAGGIDTVVLNQAEHSNEWVSLGSFPFWKNEENSVRLGDGSDSVDQEIVFDAVRFTYQSSIFASGFPPASPSEYILFQNYPNPFNPGTDIRFSIPAASHVSLTVYSILGAEVAVLVDDDKPAGSYAAHFNGSTLASGIYFYRLQAGSQILAKKMILLK